MFLEYNLNLKIILNDVVPQIWDIFI